MEPDYAISGMQPWVGSFDPLMYIYFMLATVLIPYPTYVLVATIFNWEHRKKRPARHFQDLMQGASYGVIVFIFGNYAQTLNWITILAFWITWPCYSLIAEFEFAKTSLPSWKTWPFGMYALFAGATALVLTFAAYHIYLGYLLTKTVPGFVGYYLLGLLIPLILTLLGYAAYKQQNLDAFGLSKVYNWMLSLQYKQSVASARRKQKKLAAIKAKQIAAAVAAASPTTPAATSSSTAPSAVAAGGSDSVPDAGRVHQPSNGADLETSHARSSFSQPNNNSGGGVVATTTSAHSINRAKSHEQLLLKSPSTIHISTSYPNIPSYGATAMIAVPATLPPSIHDTTLVVIDTQPDSPSTDLQIAESDAAVATTIQPYEPYVWSVGTPAHFHPHHWQLFYMLAFFTRFDHWVSRVGGGIVLGCYMQGVMAYGYDVLVEE
ncbi:hypothetical protein BG004_006080 [Podila humilis]|nr:hypothetical protein BG004_006080 [Podila humilis]